MERLTDYIGELISALAGGGVAYIFARKQKKADAENTEIQNAIQAINVYQTIIDDLKKEMKEMREEMKQMEVKIDLLIKENHDLKQQLNVS